jgi:hypothetical protein
MSSAEEKDATPAAKKQRTLRVLGVSAPVPPVPASPPRRCDATLPPSSSLGGCCGPWVIAPQLGLYALTPNFRPNPKTLLVEAAQPFCVTGDCANQCELCECRYARMGER